MPEGDTIFRTATTLRRVLGGEKICVILGDNILERSIRPHVEAFEEQGEGARLLLAGVTDVSAGRMVAGHASDPAKACADDQNINAVFDDRFVRHQ